jgi:hypothetical protein
MAANASAGLISQRSAANDSVADFNKRMPPKEAVIANAVRDAEQVGWDLYRNEALADIAGYVLSVTMTAEQRAGIEGCIVVPGSPEWVVRFYGKNDRGSYSPVADVTFDVNDRPHLRRETLPAYTLQENALIMATELAKAQKPACDGTYKTITLLKSDKSIHVYSLRNALDATHMPEGQHIRYSISPDGSKITAEREYARRCNMITTSVSKETQNEEVRLTNSLDPQPTELQIYLSLRYDVDIFLATTQSNLYWQVYKGVAKAD